MQPSTHLLKKITNMFLYWSMEWENKHVGITGHTPFDTVELSWLLQSINAKKVHLSVDWCEWVTVQDDYLAKLYQYTEDTYETLLNVVEKHVSSLDCVIVGRSEYDEQFLTFLLPYACRNPNMIVISQEDFVESFYLFSKPKPYKRNDSRVRLHEGLLYLANIGFEWPTEYWQGNEPSHNSARWAAESELKSRFGYSVAHGISMDERRASLKMAVEVKGLQWVAAFIVNHLIRVNRNNHLKCEAVDKYRKDVAWLKKLYYDGSRHTFQWPQEW